MPPSLTNLAGWRIGWRLTELGADEIRFFQGVKTGAAKMPWSANDAEKHTRKATTSELKELWAKVANESLERNGDEGRAVREANAVVARQARL
jgi:hypothetical protein